MLLTKKFGLRALGAALVLLLLAVSAAPGPAEASAAASRAPVSHKTIDEDRLGRALEALDRPIPTPALPAVTGRVLVTFEDPGMADAVEDYLRGEGAEIARIARRVLLVDEGGVAAVEATAAYAGLPGVWSVEAEQVRATTTAPRTPDDPRFREQWSHTQTGIAEAWGVTTGSPSVTVAVIDTGVNANHPDLGPNVVEQVATSAGVVEPGREGNNDPCAEGHGTAVAGVIGAVGDNGVGIAGVNWEVGLVDIRASLVHDCDLGGAFTDAGIVAAIAYAAERDDGPVDVVNLSLGASSDQCPGALHAVITDAIDAGVVVVAASGNEESNDPGTPQAPASCDGVISVGATDEENVIAPYSTTNEWVDLVAPGGGDTSPTDAILTTDVDRVRGYSFMVGTSFAAPYVAGVAALLRSVDADLTPAEVESVLERSARDLGPPGRDPAHGWGLVQPAVAVQWVADGDPIPPPQPDPDFPVGENGLDIETPPVPPEVYRIDSGPHTRAVNQAAAVSEELFEDGEALWAVLARSDDYADALAGSGLGFGLAPLLFTEREGELVAPTRKELQRVLEPDGVVYLLGGTAALPATLELELADLGYQPVRLAGRTREETAVAVAAEITALDIAGLPYALLATARNWPDAVAGGSIAAWFGLPILLTPPDHLHPVTRDALATIAPERVYALGGQLALAEGVLDAAAAAAAIPREEVVRLHGPARDSTAIDIALEFEGLMWEVHETTPVLAVAVNIRRDDAFAHALSASVVAGMFAAPFVPVEGDDGSVLTEPARIYLEATGFNVALAGGSDLLSDDVADEIAALVHP